ncbi:NAD(P)-binding domain-containing protein [Streptosporangium subroseum]|uniref:NAD(P)-binding domain-containing protein n=1 Tax=Streptosporangium subroseum TaxID=106412 RepID=UPI00352C81EA
MSLESLPLLRVGWIGAGRMGAAIARRLAQAGVDVAAWSTAPRRRSSRGSCGIRS